MKSITKKQNQLLFWMAQDHYLVWKEILSKKQIGDTLLRQLSYAICSHEQLAQVRFGIQNGLGEEQIRTFAKKGLSSKQMEKLRTLCEDGMDCKLVSLMARPRYSLELIDLIEQVLRDDCGAPTLAVRLITNPKFTFSQSQEIAHNILCGLPLNLIKQYAKPEFDAEQMRAIFFGYANKLTQEQVELYAKPEFFAKQMYEISKGLLNMPCSLEKIQLYAKPEYNASQMAVIRKGLEHSIPKEHLMLYTPPCFTYMQMEEIFRAHHFNLTIEEIKTFADPQYTAEQMKEMRDSIVYTKQANTLLDILKENF